jgi:hypothetical protein
MSNSTVKPGLMVAAGVGKRQATAPQALLTSLKMIVSNMAHNRAHGFLTVRSAATRRAGHAEPGRKIAGTNRLETDLAPDAVASRRQSRVLARQAARAKATPDVDANGPKAIVDFVMSPMFVGTDVEFTVGSKSMIAAIGQMTSFGTVTSSEELYQNVKTALADKGHDAVRAMVGLTMKARIGDDDRVAVTMRSGMPKVRKARVAPVHLVDDVPLRRHGAADDGECKCKCISCPAAMPGADGPHGAPSGRGPPGPGGENGKDGVVPECPSMMCTYVDKEVVKEDLLEAVTKLCK